MKRKTIYEICIVGILASLAIILEKVSIPISVTTICDKAFNYCTSLKSIDIPAIVTTIGEEAFNRCGVLEKITFAENSKLEVIGKNAFAFCSSSLYTKKSVINYVKANDNPYYILQELTNNTLSSYTIENNTKYITSFAFQVVQV